MTEPVGRPSTPSRRARPPDLVGRASERVRTYYRDTAVLEWRRLVRDPYHRLELETTLRFLRRYLPSHGSVLDAGGGPGRYTIELARAGFDVTLLDLTPQLLELARRNVRRAGVSDRVRGFVLGSIADLSKFRSGSFDAVLCLGGPLNHLVRARDRARALRELDRVAAPGAPIFVSVIGRFTALVDGIIRHPDGLRTDPAHHRRILRTGNYDGHRGFAPSHFLAPEELRGAIQGVGWRVLATVGLEGLVSFHDRAMNRLARIDPEAWASWKNFHLATCQDPAVVATSEHFLVVARKPTHPR